MEHEHGEVIRASPLGVWVSSQGWPPGRVSVETGWERARSAIRICQEGIGVDCQRRVEFMALRLEGKKTREKREVQLGKCNIMWVKLCFVILDETHNTTKAFLPTMLEINHGHIVTVASSLGLFSTAGVEDYCASKFGVVGFHESLSHELKAAEKDGIKTTLVCPYLVDTGMFRGCRIRSPDYCVKQAMKAILTDQPMICTPRLMYIVTFMKSILPFEAVVCMYRFLGADKCMYPFIAQRKQATNNNEAKNGI
eukprot:bmy_02176T0